MNSALKLIPGKIINTLSNSRQGFHLEISADMGFGVGDTVWISRAPSVIENGQNCTDVTETVRAESISCNASIPRLDQRLDSNWIAGAQFGYMVGEANDQVGFDAAVDARRRDIREANADEGRPSLARARPNSPEIPDGSAAGVKPGEAVDEVLPVPFSIDRTHKNQAFVTLGFNSVDHCTQFIKKLSSNRYRIAALAHPRPTGDAHGFDRTRETPRRQQAVEKLLALGWTYHHENGWAAPTDEQDGEAVAYVPVHPRNGPLWMDTYAAGTAPDRTDSYPRMALYAQPRHMGVPDDLADDAARWRFVRELAWFVDAARHVYDVKDARGPFASWHSWPSPDWDEIQGEIDKVRVAAEPAPGKGGEE